MTSFGSITTGAHAQHKSRMRGVGVGCVSILDPKRIREVCDVPADWERVAYLLMGIPSLVHDVPELVRKGWEQTADPSCMVLQR